MDFVLLRSSEREQRRQGNERGGREAESIARDARAETDEDAHGERAEAHASGLVEAAGDALGALGAQSAHHATATGHDELAEAGAEQYEHERVPRTEVLLVETERQEDCRKQTANDQPGTTAHEEVGDGTPEEVEACGQSEQADEVRLHLPLATTAEGAMRKPKIQGRSGAEPSRNGVAVRTASTPAASISFMRRKLSRARSRRDEIRMSHNTFP